MAVLLVFSVFSALFGGISGVEEAFVQFSPDFVKFTYDVPLRASVLPEVLSATLGYTTGKNFEWPGLQLGSPFRHPEAAVVIEVDGFMSVSLNLNKNKFILENDVEPNWGYQLVADRTYVRFPERNPVLLDVATDDSLQTLKLQYPQILHNIPDALEEQLFASNSVIAGKSPVNLNISNAAHMAFFRELQLLSEVAHAVKDYSRVHDGVPDVYWVRFSGVQHLVGQYGPYSAEVEEAMEYLRKTLKQVENDFNKAYDGNFIMIVLAVDYQSVNNIQRKKRQAEVPTSTQAPVNSTYNLAEDYDDTYPAIFNIIFLTMLVFALTIFGVALGMWHMDPGKDSIIYRMTNQRMRKDQ